MEIFSGEDSENTIDDWLPTLVRAAEWNGWMKTELLLQLAGHLKGRARQEWSLLTESETTRKECMLYEQDWTQEAKHWLPKTFDMQLRMRMRKSVILSVALRRHSVVLMVMTRCSLKPEMPFCTPNYRNMI